jgi:hypothetical protein
VVDGRWHHVGAVRDHRPERFGSPVTFGTRPVIGGTRRGAEMFDGLLDEVRVSSVARRTADCVCVGLICSSRTGF